LGGEGVTGKEREESRIVCDPGIRFGKPTVRGTRIAVADILSWLASGMTVEEILADWSYLTREDIIAALEYAANQLEK
jgi:uncharacterized protein (DUF433 family)